VKNSTKIRVKVKPGSKKEGIKRWDEDGALVVAVHAPAREGKANKNLIELLSSHLKIPKSDISILSGMTSREKVIEISGISEKEVKQRLRP